ncbi:MAG: DNA polymerase III, subunit gamma and tau [Spirochaetes bacterium GWD1_27_9]|nr:MAG: DNA polymerase III, subunit gamma and tau [Spirochaetes bacterium GWB1_27_13]OHD27387.1 MAG: DNA polymerase III, subunit gamma and tau [Spirochaetes bacterium GWC1_27_15]OHD43973.1 MAG: DNA polymerase III, subunit gamma and tau [Spirochaetes bacterium GWD1_27_9]
MSYEITATKFRPQSFDEVIGQEFVSTTLKNSIQNKRIPNAYLLSGPRGCGKTSTARIIAKALNCINGPTDNPCNKCENCVSITNGSNSDVIEIDGASNTSINDIRVIQEEILYPPINSKYKVYIIDEVHMLSKSAFNALLKTIEEPPKGVVFIFATTEINKVLPTIRSRCQQFNLRLIPQELIAKSLIKVLERQNVKYEEDAIKWIATEGKGSMRDSYTLLDQVISFCDANITLKRIQEKLGIVGEEKISILIRTIVNKDREDLLKEYFSLIETGISPEQIISEMIKFFRNIMLKKLNLSSNKVFGFNSQVYDDKLISSFSYDDLENILEILFSTYEKTRYSIDIQTEIEICLLKLLKYKELIRPKAILLELEKIRNQLINPNQKMTMSIPATIIEEENIQPIQQEQPSQKNVNVKVNVEKSEILKIIKNNIPHTNFQLIAALNNVFSIEEQGNTMILYFCHQMYYDTALKYNDLLTKEASLIIGKEYNIKVEYKPELKQQRPKTVGEINASRVKEIFNGKEMY